MKGSMLTHKPVKPKYPPKQNHKIFKLLNYKQLLNGTWDPGFLSVSVSIECISLIKHVVVLRAWRTESARQCPAALKWKILRMMVKCTMCCVMFPFGLEVFSSFQHGRPGCRVTLKRPSYWCRVCLGEGSGDINKRRHGSVALLPHVPIGSEFT